MRLPRQGQGDALLVIRALVDEEGVERLLAGVRQRFARERLEERVSGSERGEVSVLTERGREILNLSQEPLKIERDTKLFYHEDSVSKKSTKSFQWDFLRFRFFL